MPRETKKIEAEIIEFRCEKCNRGVYRHDKETLPLNSHPKQWLHRCSSCQNEVYFTAIYPLLKYKGREFEQLL